MGRRHRVAGRAFADYFAKGAYLAYLVVHCGAAPATSSAGSPLGTPLGHRRRRGRVLAPVPGRPVVVAVRLVPGGPRSGSEVLAVGLCRPAGPDARLLPPHAPVLGVLVLTSTVVLIHTSRAAVDLVADPGRRSGPSCCSSTPASSAVSVVFDFRLPRGGGRRGGGARRGGRRGKEPAQRLRPADPHVRPDRGGVRTTRRSTPSRPRCRGSRPPTTARLPGTGWITTGWITPGQCRSRGQSRRRPSTSSTTRTTSRSGCAPAPEVSSDRRRVAEKLANPPEHEMALYAKSRVEGADEPVRGRDGDVLFNPKTVAPWVALTAGLMPWPCCSGHWTCSARSEAGPRMTGPIFPRCQVGHARKTEDP